VAYALAQRGKPYRWGAQGPGAFDCSGLTRAAWHAAGVALPRTAAAQFHTGRRVARAELRPGDLVFFRSGGPSGWHVGLVAGRGRMVEAPGQHARVRTAPVGRAGYLGAVRPQGGGR
jgi:cell wall-associated NlpC family hydrolase